MPHRNGRRTLAGIALACMLGVSGLLALLLPPVAAQEEGAALPEAAAGAVSFAQDVHPILAERCYKCHGGGKRKGELSLESREALLEGGESGPAVEVGKSAESLLIRLVSGADPDLVMPPKGERLTPEQVGVLRKWIDSGLEWELVASAEQGYVSPLELMPPALDLAALDGANPIDHLLAAYFAEHGVEALQPVREALLARRMYLDVTGLPPAPEDLEKFLAGFPEDAPEQAGQAKPLRLARRLLANRQAYAEHWMTFWNDCLRNDFAGTGYIDGGRSAITSWLYEALYQNLPYDQFVAQLVNPTEGSAGFVNGIVWRGSTAANEKPAMQAARGVAQVFLGVNLKCASCHDSFLNHWKLTEAYGLAGCFSDEPLELVRCDVPQGETAEAAFLWPELGAIDASRAVAGRRAQLAGLVTDERNGFFTRTIVNRLWAEFFGRGLIEPLEAIESEPWSAPLLDWLAQDLIDHGYDLKRTIELIVSSKAYAARTVPGEDDPYVFRGPVPKRLSAEQFLDTLSTATGHWQATPLFALPGVTEDTQPRAWRFTSDRLTRAMGRPNREQVTLRRDEQATTLQALEMTNGALLADFLKQGAGQLIAAGLSEPEAVAKHAYLRALQRDPAAEEVQVAREIMGSPATPEGIEDFLWMLAMLPEYQYVW